MIVDIVDKYCTNDNNPIKKPTLESWSCQVQTRTGILIRCTAKKIPFMYSFSGNSAASVPISTFMCLRRMYIIPPSIHLFVVRQSASAMIYFRVELSEFLCGGGVGILRISMYINRQEVSLMIISKFLYCVSDSHNEQQNISLISLL